MRNRFWLVPTAAMILGVSGYTTAAQAQGTTPAAPPPANDTTTTTGGKVSLRTTKEIASRLTEALKANGIRIAVDSSIAAVKAPVPTEATTPENFEAQIAALVNSLPKGTTWGKLYLPESDSTRSYKGDDLADYAMAQSKLFGTVGAAPAGTVEVLGKALPADKAQAVVDTLNLKPIYLITNPTLKSGNWAALTDEQKQEFAKNEAQRILNMDPQMASKQMADMLGQQMAVYGQMFQMMSPDQRQQFGQSIMQQMQKSGGNMMFMGRPGGGQRPPQ